MSTPQAPTAAQLAQLAVLQAAQATASAALTAADAAHQARTPRTSMPATLWLDTAIIFGAGVLIPARLIPEIHKESKATG